MSKQNFFDVHAHTQFAAFKDDQDAVIERAREAGVWMVNVGTQYDTSVAAIATAQRYEKGVYASVGLHPIHTEKSHHDAKELGEEEAGFISRGEEFEYEEYKKLAGHPKVVAIGECGLDYYRLGEETKRKQHDTFLKQIELAHKTGKPLMIHCRNAFPDLISILQANSYKLQASGVIHFFTGSVPDAGVLLDLGFSFSFGGVLTFARDYDEVVRYLPLDRIVSETDAPYVTPAPYRGKRNEPLYVREVVKKIAEIRTEEYERVRDALVHNALRLFSLKGEA